MYPAKIRLQCITYKQPNFRGNLVRLAHKAVVKKILLLVLPGIFVPFSVGFAQLTACPASGPCVNSLLPMIHGIEMAAGLIFGGVAVISFLVAGVLFLTAQGQPEKIKQARSAFIWGIAGVVVGILAFSIIAIVVSVIA